MNQRMKDLGFVRSHGQCDQSVALGNGMVMEL